VNKAALVAAGILLSRVAGLVRLRVFAHYFGLSDAADAFTAAFRIPNLLQNLFGEGALSASFIPVYASLVARGERHQADRVAGAVGALLAVLVAGAVLLGIVTTPWLIAAIAPGFEGEKRALTIAIVRVLFPGAGLLVLSAWCLGVLNSHGRFLLSYAAPVTWNVAMIVTLVALGARTELPRLAVLLAWGSVAGSALQLGVQLPAVLRAAPGVRPVLDVASEHVRAVATNFVPVFISRGVVQVSAYIDALLASLLPTGAVTALTNAQLLYLLPVSLFGMSVAAAELPVMSGEVGARDRDESLRGRLDAGLRQIAFFVVPSAVVFLVLGDVVAAALLETGRFGYGDALYVWGILAGFAVGLLATTLARLYASTYYALRDTRTPLRYAIVHVVVATALGYALALPLPRWLDLPASWGAAGLTIAASVAAWIELVMLRRTLNRRIGSTGLPAGYVGQLLFASGAAASSAWIVKLALPELHPVLTGLAVLGTFGGVFLALVFALRIREASLVGERLLDRVRR
jgi:putative peptidoglycan lipid II flippase